MTLIFIIITAFLVEDRMLNPFLLYMQHSNHLVEICYSLFLHESMGRNSLFTLIWTLTQYN
jgi:hypothetical protein